MKKHFNFDKLSKYGINDKKINPINLVYKNLTSDTKNILLIDDSVQENIMIMYIV